MRTHVLIRHTPASLVILLVLLAASACSSSPSVVQPSPTTTATQVPTPLATQTPERQPSPVAGLLGPAPTNCPVAPPPSTYSQVDFGGGFIGTVQFQGSKPAWDLGLPTTLQLEQYTGAQPYPSTKVMWVVGPNYAQPVTLSGHELRTGAPLWFQIYPAPYTTQAVLDPAAPNRGGTDNSTGHWNIWGIGVVVLAAGCYELDVTSTAGVWTMVFAAGH